MAESITRNEVKDREGITTVFLKNGDGKPLNVTCGLDELSSEEPQWIPCSEKLPEDDMSKVVTLANGNAEVGYYSNGDWWCVGDKFTLENQTVIAWMPLPKPYRGDKE